MNGGNLLQKKEVGTMLRTTIRSLEASGKRYVVLELGETADGGKLYLPYAEGMVNNIAFAGVSGLGKSYGSKVIAEELAYRGIPVVIVDTTSEWEKLSGLVERTPEKKHGNEFRFNLLTLNGFRDVFTNGRKIRTFRIDLRDLTVSEMLSLIKSQIKTNPESEALDDRITSSLCGEPFPVGEIDRPNTVTVVRLPSPAESDLISKELAKITVVRIINKIAENRKSVEKHHPIHIVVDEANFFFDERNVQAVSKVLSISHKLGISLHISTQELSALPKQMLFYFPTVFFAGISDRDAELFEELYGVSEEIIDQAKAIDPASHEFLLLSAYYSLEKPILMKFRGEKAHASSSMSRSLP